MASLARRAPRWAPRALPHPLGDHQAPVSPSLGGIPRNSQAGCIRYSSTAPGFTWTSARYRYAAPAAARTKPPVEQRRRCRETCRQHHRNSPAHRSTHTVRTLRGFHTYFVTHLPSSSLHPDAGRPSHGLPRDASTPHTPSPGSSAAVVPPNMPTVRDLTVVRIPLRRAKHHFGSSTARGSRAYNEDADQAGTIDIPAFAKRAPQSVIRQKPGEAKPAESALGDPQIFYFGVFDGHGGTQCSQFLKDELHGYIEQASTEFSLRSTLRKTKPGHHRETHSHEEPHLKKDATDENGKNTKQSGGHEARSSKSSEHHEPPRGAESASCEVSERGKALRMQRELVNDYKRTIGGYFRRFSPDYFDLSNDATEASATSIESVLTYAFLRADLDFVAAQARKPDPDDLRVSDTPLNEDEVLGVPHAPPSGHGIGGQKRFKGGSTATVALISTPTPAPFWHPNAHSTLLVAHVGDTRVLLCDTATGQAHPLTSDHHPGTPGESRRLRRYAAAGSMVSGDSFGEERIAGLANSRSFGDMKSKRIGVSAEPEMTRVDMGPAQYAFLVLMSDGVSGTLSDQEIVDVIKEASTPEEGASAVVNYATEVSHDGDNATCQVVRLGGWERRSEGGVGSLGTKEIRDIRRAEAQDPRRTKQ